MRKRMLGAGICAVAVLGMAGPAVAGEVTGNGKPLPVNGKSPCAFSGLDDNIPGTGVVIPGVVQNWGHTKDSPVVVAAPRGASDVTLNFGFGDFQEGCNAHLYPLK